MKKEKKVVEDAFGDPVRLSFEVADSGDPAGTVWKDKIGKFDLVISFTAFHWIADQKKSFRMCSFMFEAWWTFFDTHVLRPY
jgi:hypothetical protein